MKAWIKKEKDGDTLKRLIFIKMRYSGLSVNKASGRVGASKSTGYNWQNAWNESGCDGLQRQYGDGRPSKLSDEQMEELYRLLGEREHWTVKEVVELVFQKFSVEYSASQITRILKYKLKLHYMKPYSTDYRRPEGAEVIQDKNATDEQKHGCWLL
ncbi:helix-turn-helix domain-containing protein [Methanoplanus endosymbiosus]|uniref:Helix-turn-helix domain-containing protein n=1 Tax=Methanoplanus endosymbiosus TaxID=33865 RepID=A0A9E7PN26_9EURY|nr:helix-turn-helix domain-containing protein [Methanoplanus endosymbiosus]UUX92890.1 helix-turn-helix domain-containing protein [Methanoplanus endosymbiosus]